MAGDSDSRDQADHLRARNEDGGADGPAAESSPAGSGPADVNANFLLALSELQFGQHEQAVARLLDCRKRAPDNPAFQFQVADVFKQAGLFDHAIDAYRAGLALDPGSLKAYIDLAFAYRLAQKLDLAIPAFEFLLDKPLDTLAVQKNLCELYYETEAWEKTLIAANAVLAAEPDYPVAQIRKAEVSVVRGQVESGFNELMLAWSNPKLKDNYRIHVRDTLLSLQQLVRLRESPTVHAAFNSDTGLKASGMDYRDDWERDAVAAITAQLPPSDKKSAIVFFHVDAGRVHPLFKSAGAKSEVDYDSASISACKFAQITNPDARVVFLTDATTDTSSLPPETEIVRLDVRRDQLMYSRMRSYRALVTANILNGPIAFLDTDICVNRPIPGIFDGTFDIGVTYRNLPIFADMPLNEGVLLARDAASWQVREFFGICLNLYETIAEEPCIKARYDFDVRNWRGGQLSLGAFVHWKIPPQVADAAVIRDLRIRYFPCAQLNYPAKANDSFELLQQKWAVHFKGIKPKKLMAPYIRYCAGADV